MAYLCALYSIKAVKLIEIKFYFSKGNLVLNHDLCHTRGPVHGFVHR